MMQIGFLVASLALLLVPGPTNTLMALAGTQERAVSTWRLILAELSGYATAIVPIAFAGAPILAASPNAALLLKMIAAAWILLLAARLWRRPIASRSSGTVRMGDVYLTTVLNPKAFIFAVILLPPIRTPDFLPHLAILAGLIVIAALLWRYAGMLTRRTSHPSCRRQIIAHRAASLWLATLSIVLMAGALHR